MKKIQAVLAMLCSVQTVQCFARAVLRAGGAVAVANDEVVCKWIDLVARQEPNARPSVSAVTLAIEEKCNVIEGNMKVFALWTYAEHKAPTLEMPDLKKVKGNLEIASAKFSPGALILTALTEVDGDVLIKGAPELQTSGWTSSFALAANSR